MTAADAPAARPACAVCQVARTLHKRIASERLNVVAASLTFSSVLALVPFFAVILSVFTAFPSFARMQQGLQEWLAGNLIPEAIASTVLENLTAFSQRASSLGAVSMAVLTFTSISLMLTIDHALGAIWRVRTPRPLGQRLLLYWAALTLGPLLLGASVAITSFLAAHSGAWTAWLPEKAGVASSARQGVALLLRALRFLLPVGGLALLYHFVPNCRVRWRHALAGALFAAAGLALLRWGMGVYLARMPSYSLIYGTFATVPLLLLWMHISWMIVLCGAVLAAALPALGKGGARTDGAGFDFQLACEALAALAAVRHEPRCGLSTSELAGALRVSEPQLQRPLHALTALAWTGLLPEGEGQPQRHVLLIAPETTPLQPLVERLLLAPGEASGGAALPGLWQAAGGWAQLTVQQALQELQEPAEAMPQDAGAEDAENAAIAP